MTKLTKMRSSGFQGQVSVRTRPSPHHVQPPGSCECGESLSGAGRLWGSATCHRSCRLLPGLLLAESRPVLLLWRQAVRTGSQLLMSFRFPKAILPGDVPLEPLGAG